MIKVSVIVPVYNVEKYLADCLDSLTRQTLKEIEIIAVNDGATDGCSRILNEYAKQDKRIKVITQENGGQSVARNRGVQEASGEYVAFVDADDYIEKDFLEKLYEAAKRESADIAAGEIVLVGEDGKCKGKVSKKKYSCLNSLREKWQVLLDNGEHCFIWNKIYRREPLIAEKMMFAEGCAYEDMLWSPRALKVLGKAVMVPEVFYYYRYNPTSITRSVEADEKKVADYKEARRMLVRFAGYYKLPMSFVALERSVYKLFGVPIFKIEYGDTGYKLYILGLCCLEKNNRKRM